MCLFHIPSRTAESARLHITYEALENRHYFRRGHHRPKIFDIQLSNFYSSHFWVAKHHWRSVLDSNQRMKTERPCLNRLANRPCKAKLAMCQLIVLFSCPHIDYNAFVKELNRHIAITFIAPVRSPRVTDDKV